MQESKSCALPLGDSPLKTLFLTLHASLNYKRKGWVVGLEPTISRTTIWRANQLHHTHHNEPGGIRTLDLRLRRPLLYPAELQTHFNIPFSKGSPYFYGKAGDGNRTHVSSLEGWCSTIELHPHDIGVTGFEPATSWSQTRRSSQAEPHPVNKVSRFAFNPFALDARFIILHCFRFVNTFFHFFQNVFCVVLFSPDNKEILSYLFSSVNT